MITLIGKEMRMLLRSIVFYLMIAVAALFYFSQYAASETWRELSAPTPPVLQADGTYGFRELIGTKEIAESKQGRMMADLSNGTMMKYTFGFGKTVKLSEKEKIYFQETITKLDVILASPDKYTPEDVEAISAGLNKKLGGTTYYARGGMTGIFPMNTLEEAQAYYGEQLKLYEEKVSQGQLYPGAARLFSDYMGLTAGIFPVFLAAFILPKDRSSRMHELIYSRKIPAWKYVGGKFAALALLLSAVYLLFSVVAAAQTVDALNQEKDLLKVLPIFIGYAAWWLLPTIWMTVAFGMFVSALFKRGIVAIPFQLVWWFLSVLPLTGSYGLQKLFLRFNTADEYELFKDSLQAIVVNRVSYAVVAMILVACTSVLWERSRSRSAKESRRKGRKAALQAREAAV